MRAKITGDLKMAMKAGEKQRVATLRLINAAVQSAEIESKATLDDASILAVMTKMVKQRRDSIEQYTSGGRPELAAAEQAEIDIIEGYLPKQMDDAEVAAAVRSALTESGAQSAKDMGKVMGVLKAKYAGKMDFQKASAAVKAALAS
ncbi:glutamyl-tRNA amidotransferase [Hyphomicrobium methylovorum]|uniref:GatB/YqeY domain-containing protein n=1 Tax=Hyphomicrobium methylovorum TaxID=84 RepID=UPI0015E789E0|nr:GatB/YqeY domain-containing protein [Hyphomicrobium methylovorum]MBA2124829.1 glutamyl-tRNA amidotransferase [Hyphomicrobium methylovorum]